MSNQVEVQISKQDLQKRKIMIATPMYGGMAAGTYTKSCTDLVKVCANHGVQVDFFYLFNESLITRARNYLVDEFMRSDFTHLMFIDADIGFDPMDVLALAALADEREDREIVCGPYPKKAISWEKIKRAVDKGFADQNPNVLERYVGDYVFNPASGANQIALNAPVEVLEGGTGFMMITRSAFEKFRDAYPQYHYKPDHVRTKNFDGSREIMAYFDALIDDKNANVVAEMEEFYKKNPEATQEDVIEFLKDKKASALHEKRDYSNRYLSEDYMFCQWARNIGVKVWMCPWMKLTHMGSYMFGGSLIDLAQIGASATVGNDFKLK